MNKTYLRIILYEIQNKLKMEDESSSREDPPDVPDNTEKSYISHVLGAMKDLFSVSKSDVVTNEEEISRNVRQTAEILVRRRSVIVTLGHVDVTEEDIEELAQIEPEIPANSQTVSCNDKKNCQAVESDRSQLVHNDRSKLVNDRSHLIDYDDCCQEKSVNLKEIENNKCKVKIAKSPVKSKCDSSELTNDINRIDDAANSSPSQRVTRNKIKPISATSSLKRSARRRSSREFSDSVVKNAIARKEKSYDNSSICRPVRPLKPTQKVLDNLAAASQKQRLKFRVKSSRHPRKDSTENAEESTLRSANNSKRFLCTKRNGKKIKLENFEKDSCASSDDNLEVKIKQNTNNNDGLMTRRSQRLSSSRKDDDTSSSSPTKSENFETLDIKESPQIISATDQLIQSRICLCTTSTNIFIKKETGVVFCDGLDSIDNKLIGCCQTVNTDDVSARRPSSRIPFALYCEMHKCRLLKHNCCPTCGIFCTQGDFSECKNNHQYHKDCQLSVGDKSCCPHCGLSDLPANVRLKLDCTSNNNSLFVPRQTLKSSTASLDPSQESAATENVPNLTSNDSTVEVDAVTNVISIEELTNSDMISNSDSSLVPVDITTVSDCILNERYGELRLILGNETPSSPSLDLTVTFSYPPLFPTTSPSSSTPTIGTLLHYACALGRARALRLILKARAHDERAQLLRLMDSEQNTAVAVAVANGHNECARVLLKYGADIVTRGPDGMSPLHLAAKAGNMAGCSILLAHSTSSCNIQYVNSSDDGGWTALVWACEHAHCDVAKLLLANGADPMVRDVEQNLAIHWASYGGHTDVLETLLCEAGGDGVEMVNAVNIQGDTPLHLAAHQDHTGCIVQLLSNGANPHVTNKMREQPLDLTERNSDSYKCILLYLQENFVGNGETSSRIILLNNDISRGRESNPIQLINAIDTNAEPKDYHYVSCCFTTNDIHIDTNIASLQHCTCSADDIVSCLTVMTEDGNETGDCQCLHGAKVWYDVDGRLAEGFNFNDPPAIYECNDLCECNSLTCGNRVVQRLGSVLLNGSIRTQVFRTELKGWGLKTLRNISQGSYVCEYVGEIVTESDVDNRSDDTYVFDLDRESDLYCIDAKFYGNMSRFINHSCQPNLVPVKVFTNHHDLRFPRIAFFANQYIEANEELSFDYGEKFWIFKYKSNTCECRSEFCKYSKHTINATLETITIG